MRHWPLYSFNIHICVLFNDTINSSDYIVGPSNYSMLNN
jgi:hypothetical protein